MFKLISTQTNGDTKMTSQLTTVNKITEEVIDI